MVCAAINMKSYGIILMIPTGLIAFIIITRKLLTNQPKVVVTNSSDRNPLNKLLIILGVSTLILFSIQTTLVHQDGLIKLTAELIQSPAIGLTRKAPWGFDLKILWSIQDEYFCKDHSSLHSLKPYLPIRADLKSPINDSIIPEALQGDKGSASGSFTLLYGTNPDMAYPFFGFQMGLILGLLGWCLSKPQKGLASALFIVTSSGLTFLFF